MGYITPFKDMVFTAWAKSYNDDVVCEYDGRKAEFGTIAVNKEQIPLGSILEIETVDDGRKYFYTGIAKNEIRLTKCEPDLTLKLWFKNNEFGKRWVKITVKEVGTGYSSTGILGSLGSSTALMPGTVVVIPGKNEEENSLAVAYDEVGETSTGTRTGIGTIAVNPKLIPYGTKLSIKRKDGGLIYGKDRDGNIGYNKEYIGVAADTGQDVRDNKFIADIWMPTKAMNDFGKRKVIVTVI